MNKYTKSITALYHTHETAANIVAGLIKRLCPINAPLDDTFVLSLIRNHRREDNGYPPIIIALVEPEDRLTPSVPYVMRVDIAAPLCIPIGIRINLTEGLAVLDIMDIRDWVTKGGAQ